MLKNVVARHHTPGDAGVGLLHGTVEFSERRLIEPRSAPRAIALGSAAAGVIDGAHLGELCLVEHRNVGITLPAVLDLHRHRECELPNESRLSGGRLPTGRTTPALPQVNYPAPQVHERRAPVRCRRWLDGAHHRTTTWRAEY